ncbi:MULTISPECIES: type II toxin-antitoxin system CcdA family antitoxin [unclassified Providencia]|nr:MULTISPECIES: type II toxin-antitoxin system CcdA family antitoxin [unclassified Providencia]
MNRTKKTVSVTVAPELYEQARRAKLNLSAYWLVPYKLN